MKPLIRNGCAKTAGAERGIICTRSIPNNYRLEQEL